MSSGAASPVSEEDEDEDDSFASYRTAKLEDDQQDCSIKKTQIVVDNLSEDEIDQIVHRSEIKNKLTQILSLLLKRAA